jgi:putative ABC transport system ATP-binding protein
MDRSDTMGTTDITGIGISMGNGGVTANTGMVLVARDVSKVYRRGDCEVPALRGVSFAVERGGFVAITGPSGSGKTTLLNILAGLDRPSDGEVRVGGERLSDLDPEAATAFRRRHIGFVFQFFNLLPTMSAHDNVALPLLAERRPRREVEGRVEEMLEAVGLAARAQHRPGELSGGEQQRVAIARALVMSPELILADEPTGNLDTETGGDILTLLRHTIASFGAAIVMVTHSELAAEAADRVLCMRDGVVTKDGGPPARRAMPVGMPELRACAS